MRFDTILTGGGLSALVCGIRLQRNGVKTAVVSSGQSSLFFFSGAFGFLTVLPDGSPVERPLDALAALPENHPYSKIGAGNIAGYADGFKDFFASCGVKLNGCGESNWADAGCSSKKCIFNALSVKERAQFRNRSRWDVDDFRPDASLPD